MICNKSDILNALPVKEQDLTIRAWTRDDIDLLTRWPGYPFPYSMYDLEFALWTPDQKDQLFQMRKVSYNTITIVADYGEQRSVGVLALFDIDWDGGIVNNMGVRVSTDLCGKGIGSGMLDMVSRVCMESGFGVLRLDAASWNKRAIRCYEKAGYRLTGEDFWKETEELNGVDFNEPRWEFISGDVRSEGEKVKVRHWWLERGKAF